jgi:hypothetical protein
MRPDGQVKVARVALARLATVVATAAVVSVIAAVALTLVANGTFQHYLRTALAVVGVVLLVFGAAGAGGLPIEYRVLTNTRIPGLGATTLSDDQTMTVSATALLIAASVFLILFAFLV